MENVKHPYVGEELDRKLAEFNLTRNPGEDDWSFRKRAFLPIFKIDRELAFVFLIGGLKSEWDSWDALIYAALADAMFSNPKFQSDEAIQKIIDKIPLDPLLLHERRNVPLANLQNRN